MTVDRQHHVLIISNRVLVAQGIVSLLETLPGIGKVDVAESLFEARTTVQRRLPDVLFIDLPAGADYFVDRPMEVGGYEIKTIVMQDDPETGEARLYVHNPSMPANLQNLSTAILHGSEPQPAAEQPRAVPVDAQPTSLIRASASGPSSPRTSSSSREL
jgi:DNA-binding NarL/FixJ family response regulator